VKSFELQYKSGEEWINFYTGTKVGTRKEISINPIEARSVRLLIDSFENTPRIFEIMLL
jgi:hypothetical protein